MKFNLKMKNLLYMCSFVMLICTIFIIYRSNVYITSLIDQGLNIKQEFLEVINYYIVNVTPLIFYTIVLLILGYLINLFDSAIQNNNNMNNKKDISKYKFRKKYDEEIDDLFNSIEVKEDSLNV